MHSIVSNSLVLWDDTGGVVERAVNVLVGQGGAVDSEEIARREVEECRQEHCGLVESANVPRERG